MSLDIHWFIPTHGDGRYLGTAVGGRAITAEYLRQLAGAIDQLGYAGALLPTGKSWFSLRTALTTWSGVMPKASSACGFR